MVTKPPDADEFELRNLRKAVCEYMGEIYSYFAFDSLDY